MPAERIPAGTRTLIRTTPGSRELSVSSQAKASTGSVTAPLLDASQIWRAMNVQERLAVVREIADFSAILAKELQEGESRVARWKRSTALDGSTLPEPTTIYGCTELELKAILDEDDAPLAYAAREAGWSHRLNDAWREGAELLASESAGGLRQIFCVEGNIDRPFAKIAQPLSIWATNELLEAAERLSNDRSGAPFAPTLAVELFVPSLIARLDTLCRRSGVLELHAARISGELIGRSSSQRFQSFVAQVSDPEVSRMILRRSPVMARLAFTLAESWLSAAKEFLTHLNSDWPDLHKRFGFADDDQLAQVQTTGDLHNGGRAVLCLGFASGRRLVYKPRSVEVEAQFQRLLEWLCSKPRFPELRRLTIVAKGDHGWVEYVDAHECPIEDLPTLYRRYGALLAVLRALAATDCHFQNVVTAGPEPVILDLEALFHAFPSSDLDTLGPGEQAVLEATDGSVLTVGLLPIRRWSNASDRSVDISGLGAREDEWSKAKRSIWLDEFTDEMREEIADGPISAGPEPSPRSDSLFAHVDDVAVGFERAYRAMFAHADSLLSDDGPLAAFAMIETRSVPRPTGQYTYLLQSTTHPSFLADGVRLDRRLDQLIAARGAVETSKELTESERSQLWQLDVPLFRTHPGTRDVSCTDGVVADYLSETGLERSRRRVEQMNETDLERQLWLIRLSIATWAINRRDVDEGDKKAALPLVLESAADELDAAILIAHRLCNIAERRGGEATWIGAQYRPVDDTWGVDAVSPNLFDGLGGIIFFLAYVSAAKDDYLSFEVAREAFRTFERQVERALSTTNAELLTGFSGVGGWIHLLTHLSALWRDDGLLRQAVDLVPLVRAGLPNAPSVDVVSGAAGAIRPLLNLYEASGALDAMECAVACGDSIIDASVPRDVGCGWLSPAGAEPLAGFAHGAAGVSWSLLKLYAATHNQRFLDSALAGITYERSLFSPRYDNWRDLRIAPSQSGAAVRPSAYFWCHGSVGIGLGRIDSLGTHRDAECFREIKAAVRTTVRHGFRADHSLCHGYGGSAELLMLAEEHGLSSSPRSVGSWGAAMLQNMRDIGCRTGCPLGVEVPGLMMGIAGLGYGLLRLVDPTFFPSVLLLEPPRVDFRLSRARAKPE